MASKTGTGVAVPLAGPTGGGAPSGKPLPDGRYVRLGDGDNLPVEASTANWLGLDTLLTNDGAVGDRTTGEGGLSIRRVKVLEKLAAPANMASWTAEIRHEAGQVWFYWSADGVVWTPWDNQTPAAGFGHADASLAGNPADQVAQYRQFIVENSIIVDPDYDTMVYDWRITP